ncbi:MAG: S9 family peptidase [Bacteroidetes bacterium]|nr:MAG: S9 family peptidase [Bacteroidota bacterium]
MKFLNKAFFLTLLSISIAGSSTGNTKQISLQTIFESGDLSARGIHGLNSMNDGLHYSVQAGQCIEQYSYESGILIDTLFNAGDFEQLASFSGYAFSRDEQKILIETDRMPIYRHSYKAKYYVYNRNNKQLVGVSLNGPQQLAAFSPDGSMVAFVRDNNLYISWPEKNKEEQITFDGQKNTIINGAPDWVYEEEFGFSRGFYWSPDGEMIAFYRFDESRVREFGMPIYGDLYPESYRFKYPKAGEENAQVSIHVYNLKSGRTSTMDTGPERDQYIPRIKWTRTAGILSIMRLNRLQNTLHILHAEAVTGKAVVVYEEINDRYISEVSDQTLTYLPDGESLILISEKSGYFHLYHYNFRHGQISPITSGDYDVAKLLGFDEKTKTVYYSSYEESSIERHVYRIGLNAKGKKKLSTRAGNNSASFSSSYKYFILQHSAANSPPYITLHNQKGKLIRVLEDNARLRENMIAYGYSPTEFLTIDTESGQKLNAWMIKPADFDSSQNYPLFIYVYGGPESQNVMDTWNYREAWFQMLAQKGYVVACIDNRGTNGRGEDFRKVTYMNLGKLETIDQIEAARWLGQQDYIDAKRMGIFGWSFGGYLTSLCMTRGQGTFRMGIAVAPVTTWRYYDTIYTERFMRSPQENPKGYDENSPLNYADQLQGHFLLIHGSADDNVHYQNSMDFVEALVQAGKQFEMQIYPNKNHGIRGGNTSYHLYTRMTDFILENL